MSAKPIYQNLFNLFTKVSEKESPQDIIRAFISCCAPLKYIGLKDLSLEQISGSLDKKEKEVHRFDLLSVFFPSLLGETFHWLDGKEIPPFKVYKLGDRYYVSDDRGLLAAAHRRGLAYIQAEVWEFTRC